MVAMSPIRAKAPNGNGGRLLHYIGETLQHFRIAQEWNQKDVASRLSDYFGKNVTQGYVSRVERGKVPSLSVEQLEAFCHIFGISIFDGMNEVKNRIEIAKKYSS